MVFTLTLSVYHSSVHYSGNDALILVVQFERYSLQKSANVELMLEEGQGQASI